LPYLLPKPAMNDFKDVAARLPRFAWSHLNEIKPEGIALIFIICER